MYFEAKRTVLIAIIDYSLELTREIKNLVKKNFLCYNKHVKSNTNFRKGD